VIIMGNFVPKICNWCQGSGYGPIEGFLDAFDRKICPVCKGQGSVLAIEPARRCSICEGTGRDMSGFLAVYDNPKRCRACGGSGWAHAL
jgi:DnaJ-class molecular chaperone